MNKIQDRLYLGSVADSKKPDPKITAILCAIPASSYPRSSYVPTWGSRKRRFIDINDGEEIPERWLEAALEQLDTWVEDGETILVHCAAGISRSPGLVVAYLMSYGASWEEAERVVRLARPIILIHPDIKKSILKYFKSWPYAGSFSQEIKHEVAQ